MIEMLNIQNVDLDVLGHVMMNEILFENFEFAPMDADVVVFVKKDLFWEMKINVSKQKRVVSQ